MSLLTPSLGENLFLWAICTPPPPCVPLMFSFMYEIVHRNVKFQFKLFTDNIRFCKSFCAIQKIKVYVYTMDEKRYIFINYIHTGRLIKKGEMEIGYVSCDFFHFTKFQQQIFIIQNNYTQPGRFAYNYFPKL